MSRTPAPPPTVEYVRRSPRRPLLHRLFRAGLGRNLITVWDDEKARHAFGQVETETRVQLGRYTVLRWTTYRTPLIDDAQD